MNVENRGWRSCSSFGLFRDDEENSAGNTYTKNRRFQLSFAVVAVALVIVTGVFVALQVTRSARETVAKAKRFIQFDNPESDGKKTQTDENIVPESKNYPNHRYDQQQSNGQIMERIMKNVYSEWLPEGEPKTRNNIRDIIRRIEMRENLRKEKEATNSRGIGKPILFKGVYVRKGKPEGDPENDSDVEYFKEINEMLQGEKSSTQEKSVPSYRGSPFQLKSQADGNDEITGTASEEIRKKARKPITVMLDIYPVTKEEEEIGKKDPRKNVSPFLLPEAILSNGRNLAYALVPKKGGGQLGLPKNNRMIMKLNLFPKKPSTAPKLDKSPSQLNRRTFGWFKKKPEGHVCEIVHPDPRLKPVTAEWKDEHGDWIKANYLTLEYWDKKFK